MKTNESTPSDLLPPKGVSKKGKLAHRVVMEFLRSHGMANTGGCRAFYSPYEWRARGESYGTKSVLVVCHDGGDLASIFNLDYCQYGLNEEMGDALAKEGLFAEQCTSWYSAIYAS